ncbi:hypothetical protein ACERIT_13275 [Halopenitus sp. H-Gu1]
MSERTDAGDSDTSDESAEWEDSGNSNDDEINERLDRIVGVLATDLP